MPISTGRAPILIDLSSSAALKSFCEEPMTQIDSLNDLRNSQAVGCLAGARANANGNDLGAGGVCIGRDLLGTDDTVIPHSQILSGR